MHRLVTKLGLPKRIDASLSLLKVHLPYHESDHVQHRLQRVVRRHRISSVCDMTHECPGCSIPDPTTAGDFCFSTGHRQRASTRSSSLHRVAANLCDNLIDVGTNVRRWKAMDIGHLGLPSAGEEGSSWSTDRMCPGRTLRAALALVHLCTWRHRLDDILIDGPASIHLRSDDAFPC